jgi:hypothetical protein
MGEMAHLHECSMLSRISTTSPQAICRCDLVAAPKGLFTASGRLQRRPAKGRGMSYAVQR